MAVNTWSGYPNGRIPLNKMNQYGSTGKYMQPDAVNWLTRLINAAKAAGYTFRVLPAEDLYRDYARQQYFWDNQRTLGVVAAYPGTSNHGWGLAADVDGTQNASAWAWLRRNAPSYNYKLLTVPSEKWHWVYTGPTTTTAGGGATPIPADEDEWNDEMGLRLYSRTDGGVVTYALGSVDPGWRTPGRNFWFEGKASALRDWSDYWGPAKEIPTDTWNQRSNDKNRISDVNKYLPYVTASQVSATVNIDYAALAKAVNDDAAKRMAA